MDLFGQNCEDLYEERHGGDVTVVPEGAETDSSHPQSALSSNTWTASTKAQKRCRFLLLYEGVNTSFPGGHLEGEVRDGQRQLRGRRDRLGTRRQREFYQKARRRPGPPA